MVDLNRVQRAGKRSTPTNPIQIFERLPKPEGVNDLWKSQHEALVEWDRRRSERDLVIKLNTGGGKTLVGLLIAQSRMNEGKRGALYLCATNQLVDQTVAKANAFKLPVVRYEAGAGRPLPTEFENGEATLVATYRALFHGYSKFKVRGRGSPATTSAIICDDAHTAFSDVRDAFSVIVTRRESEELYRAITSLLRPSAESVDKLGSFDLRVGGQDLGVFEVPYWEWRKVSNEVRNLLQQSQKGSEFEYQLPLAADFFDVCQVFVRASDVMITPLLPPVDLLPTFSECSHRVFMSATIADDSALVRTFDTAADAVLKPIAPRSLAGVGERMILSPALTPIGAKGELRVAKRLASRVASEGSGAVILAASEALAKARWGNDAQVVVRDDVTRAVDRLTDRASGDNGPYVLVNRYDGVDLARDACRLLVLDGLPRGASAYDEYRANAFRGSRQIELNLAQRIEQGIGRGTRGAGDYCVVLLIATAQEWVARRTNAALMTPATRAQIALGLDVSRLISDEADFDSTVDRCLTRESEWVSVHAAELADRAESSEEDREAVREAIEGAMIERRFLRHYRDGQYQAARTTAEEAADAHGREAAFRGWLLQLAARAGFRENRFTWSADLSGLQTRAATANTHLYRPPGSAQLLAPPAVEPQAQRIANKARSYAQGAGYLAAIERVAFSLTGTVSASEFEEAVRELGEYIGFASDRLDQEGEGPDNVWRTHDGRIFVISCKNRKGASKPLHKKDLSQLFVDAKWIEERFPKLGQMLLVAHPTEAADPGIPTEGVRALTFAGLSALVGAVKQMAESLVQAGTALAALEAEANLLLKKHRLDPDGLLANYTSAFKKPAS